MTDAPAFTLVCEHLERATGLDRPAARGTVRLALKEAGLDVSAIPEFDLNSSDGVGVGGAGAAQHHNDRHEAERKQRLRAQ